jgi:photosystem II stability/assembly factor-like uncharacterized protein
MERLEHDLREVMTDPRRALPADAVRLEAVYAGAARRRRRRAAAVTVAAGLAAVLAAAPVALLRDGGPSRDRTPPASPSPTSAPTSAPAETTPPPTPGPSSAPPPSAVGPVWGDATVVSVTATSSRGLVVLGTDKDRCVTDCTRLARSDDAGRTWTALAAPGAAFGGGGRTLSSVTDVRFGSAADGWAFGDGLWATHDGGRSWAQLHLPGRVSRLEAAAGTVWAVVTAQGGSTSALWRSPVTTDDWAQVRSVSPLTAPADVGIQGRRVIVLGGQDSLAWTSADGRSFARQANPCAGRLGGRMSTTVRAVWVTCTDGTSASLFLSRDGASFRQVLPSFLPSALSNQVVLGARTDADAVLVAEPDKGFVRVHADGAGEPVPGSPDAGLAPSYIGFTTAQVGLAVTGGRLWRTADGGAHWAEVTIR